MTVIPFAFPGLPRIRCAFQTRVGGASREPFAEGNYSLDVGDDPNHVLKNRNMLRDALGFTACQELKQVHGADMLFDPRPQDICERGAVEADGMATSRPGQALVIKTADCQPVMLAHSSGNFIAALHVGWRGNTLHFPTTGATAFCDHYDLDPIDVLAVRGPSLGPSASEFRNFSSEFGPAFHDYHDPATRCVDLWRLTRDQLLDAGLLPQNIFSLDLCTFSLTNHFFSYRRDHHCGRHANLIWIA